MEFTDNFPDYKAELTTRLLETIHVKHNSSQRSEVAMGNISASPNTQPSQAARKNTGRTGPSIRPSR